MRKTVIAIVLLALCMPAMAQEGFVIDHTTADIHAIPQNWIDSAQTKLKVRYFRRSHGSHIDVGGMAALRRYSPEYAEIYNYNTTGAGGALKLTTKWHSLDFENAQWVQITRDFLDDPANSDINVMMWAWSSYLYNLDVEQYITDMEALIADYGPGGNKIESGERTVPVTFIYHTGCSQKSTSRNEPLFERNQRIRQHCAENNRILFDFNDIESYNPDGEYFGDGNPDGTYTSEHLLNDDCSYKLPTGDRGNWGIEWNTENADSELAQLSADEICTTCEHSMGTDEGEIKDNSRLHCVLKGQAVWWLFAKLAGWGQVVPEASVTISSAKELTESNLDGQTISVTLSACSFSTESLASENFILNNAPAGLTISDVSFSASDKAILTLAFDGTDFSTDISNFSITISNKIISASTDLTSNELLIVAENITTLIWTGAVDNDWNNSGNWNPEELPDSENDVVIPKGLGTYPESNSGGDIVVNNLTIESGAKFQLPIANHLQVVSDLNLFSDVGEYSQIIDNENIEVSGDIKYNKFLGGKVYHYVSSPLTSVPSTVFTNTPLGFNRNYYVYLESNTSDNWLAGWNHAAAIGNMQSGAGYAYYYTNDYTFQLTGGQLNSGDISIDIFHSNNGVISDGWNIVGNPYSSAISADEFIYENQGIINGTIYFWDDDNSGGTDYSVNDYASWNLAGSIGTGTGETSEDGIKIPDGYIAPMQGFFIKKVNAGNDQLWFRNSMRTFGNGQYYRTQNNNSRLKLSLTNQSATLYNEILIAFVEEASNRFDNLYDGIKLKGNPDIAFYSMLDKHELGIQSFRKPMDLTPISKSVALGFEVSKNNYYKIDLAKITGFASNASIWLEDKQLNKIHKLGNGNTYSFYCAKGIYNSRFVVHINPSKRLFASLIKKYSEPKVYYAKNSVVIETNNDCTEASYTIYNLMGFPLKQGYIEGNRTEVPMKTENSAGLVEIKCPGCNYAKKIAFE